MLDVRLWMALYYLSSWWTFISYFYEINILHLEEAYIGTIKQFFTKTNCLSRSYIKYTYNVELSFNCFDPLGPGIMISIELFLTFKKIDYGRNKCGKISVFTNILSLWGLHLLRNIQWKLLDVFDLNKMLNLSSSTI